MLHGSTGRRSRFRHFPGRSAGGHGWDLLDAGMAGPERVRAAPQLLDSGKPDGQRVSTAMPPFAADSVPPRSAVSALYLLIYSLLGAAVRFVRSRPFHRPGDAAAGRAFLRWAGTILSFHLLGRTLMPLVWLLHAENSTAFGHVLFGALSPDSRHICPSRSRRRRSARGGTSRRNRPARSRFELSDAGLRPASFTRAPIRFSWPPDPA